MTKQIFKSKKVKIIFIILISLIIAFSLLALVRAIYKNQKTQNVLYTVRNETYSNEISIAGVVSAAHEQTLQALSAGTVMAVYVKQGDVVKTGDVIIQLDDTTQQYNLARHDYDMESVKISGSKKELALKESERLSLLQKIAERKVTATFDGIIADIDVSVGDSLEAKDSVGTLVDTSYLIAEVEVAETDVSKLKIGQEVDFKFSACKETVKGYVTGWPAIGTVTSRGATVVKVQLRIDDYPETVLPNFSFSGSIKISPEETYTIIERYAVGRENGQAYVVKNKSSEKISVKVEKYHGDYVKIIEGNIEDGDVLIQQTQPRKSGTKRNTGNNPPVMPMGGMR